MAQSLCKITVHLIFATKGRAPLITDEIRTALHSYIGKVLIECDCHPIQINSVVDHVHILFSLGKLAVVSKVVEDVKKGSSKWMKSSKPDFYWQGGYGIFSVSEEHVPNVQRYVLSQREHHQMQTFEDEIREIYKLAGLEFDENYLWS